MNYLFGKPVRVSGHLSTLVQPIRGGQRHRAHRVRRRRPRMVDVRWHSRVPRDEFRVRGTEGEMDCRRSTARCSCIPAGPKKFPTPPICIILYCGFCRRRGPRGPRPRSPRADMGARSRVGDGAGHCLTMVKCSAKYESQAISAAARMVSTHAHTMFVAMPPE